MQYYGTRLSENISRREPEGYLLCLNVPVARTGYQEYLPEELGIEPTCHPAIHEGTPPTCHPERSEGSPYGSGASGNTGQALGVISTKGPTGPRGEISSPVQVYRPESEVFSKETIASFEGVPVTNDHPPDGVNLRNDRRYRMGHAQNVRRGTGEESDLLLADLVITDSHLIDLILSGKREISCGYTYDLSEENGQFIQRKIRGNHIAVVDAGRAGHRVSIKDEQPSESPIQRTAAMLQPSASDECRRSQGGTRRSHSQAKEPANKERRQNPMKKNLTNWLKKKAKDGDMETVAEFIEEVIGEAEEQEAPAPIETEEPVVVEVPENREITIDEESGILQRLDQLIALLTEYLHPAPAADEEPEKAEEIAEAVEEVIEAAEEENIPAEEIAEMVESVLEEEEELSTTIEEDECEEEKRKEQDAQMRQDALRAVLSAVRPALAAMPPKQRRKAANAIADRLNSQQKGKDSSVYAALAKSSRKPEPDLSDLGRRIMEKRNPHYMKQQ